MKLFFSLLAILITGNAFSQWSFSSPGRVKISLVKFYCTKETLDNDADGKKDEVFFSFMYTVAGINGNTKLSSKSVSGVFGDATGPFSSRSSAGSATDIFGNNRGGVKSDDVVDCNFTVLDINLEAGDVISIVPSIWEWDNNNFNVQQSFEGAIMAAFPQMNTKVVEDIKFCYPKTEEQSCFVKDGTGYLGIPNCSNILQSVSDRPGNRPIGMTSTGAYSPTVITMGADMLEKIAAMQFRNIGLPGHTNVGNLPVAFNEEALGNTRDHGNYGIYLKVEFIKTAVSTPLPPKKIKPPFNGQISNQPVTLNITGKWTGTYGSGEYAIPNFYSFQLNTDGTMQLLNEIGGIAANGTYSLINNVITGNYKYNSGSVFSFTGAVQNNNNMSGTWGGGNNVSSGGKWILNK